MTQHCQPQENAAAEPHAEAASDPFARLIAALLPDVVIGGLDGGEVAVTAPASLVVTGPRDDAVTLDAGVGEVALGDGDDHLELTSDVGRVDGGDGHDTVAIDAEAGSFDLAAEAGTVTLSDRFTGETTTATSIETFAFADATFDRAAIDDTFGPGAAAPDIRVGEGTQTVTVNAPEPTVSVLWDRVVQQAVIDTDGGVGPTVASRAYAMVHTAMFDAWASYEPEAVRVSFDAEGDNAVLADGLENTDANQAKAMSVAAATVLSELFPDQQALIDSVMVDRLGFALDDDGSAEAAVGLDAAEDLLTLRREDGSAAESDYEPVNPNPNMINDITRWTPENVPIDPEDDAPEQSFLTPQWPGVESFALPEGATIDQQAVDRWASNIVDFEAASHAGEVAGHAAAGLDAPALEVSISTEQGREYVVSVGDPSGPEAYYLRASGPNVLSDEDGEPFILTGSLFGVRRLFRAPDDLYSVPEAQSGS
jgi:hypothetical protein